MTVVNLRDALNKRVDLGEGDVEIRMAPVTRLDTYFVFSLEQSIEEGNPVILIE